MERVNQTDEELMNFIVSQSRVTRVSGDEEPLAEMELVRRGLVRLNDSSHRLARLTKALVGLTILSAVLTAVFTVLELRLLYS